MSDLDLYCTCLSLGRYAEYCQGKLAKAFLWSGWKINAYYPFAILEDAIIIKLFAAACNSTNKKGQASLFHFTWTKMQRINKWWQYFHYFHPQQIFSMDLTFIYEKARVQLYMMATYSIFTT